MCPSRVHFDARNLSRAGSDSVPSKFCRTDKFRGSKYVLHGHISTLGRLLDTFWESCPPNWLPEEAECPSDHHFDQSDPYRTKPDQNWAKIPPKMTKWSNFSKMKKIWSFAPYFGWSLPILPKTRYLRGADSRSWKESRTTWPPFDQVLIPQNFKNWSGQNFPDFEKGDKNTVARGHTS